MAVPFRFSVEKQIRLLLQQCKWYQMLCGWLPFWIFFVFLLTPVSPEVIYRVDPLALLAATLRTYQRAGCDSEQLSLSCPRGTSISIELAQYGRAGDLSDHSLCPPLYQEDFTTTGSSSDDGGKSGILVEGNGVVHSGTEIEVNPPEICTVNGLQYALLQTVVDACQKKRHCKFSANMKPLASGDPCARIRKFVEIAYKCRPYEFRSKITCENDNMPLVCNPYSRIAIYSASFGHIERERLQCQSNNTQARPVTDKQTCLVSYATETVMQICHGRRRCSVTADAGTFGRPCKNDIPMHLKVVYTCIPRKVLKDRYETAPEPDEPQQSELDLDQDELYDEDQFYKEGETIPPAPKLQGAIPNAVHPYDYNMHSNEATTTLSPFILSRNDNNLEENKLGSTFEDVDGNYVDITLSTNEVNTNTIITTTTTTPTDDKKGTGIYEQNNQTSVNGNGYYIYQTKCQMEDDWGTIGLNCTNDDIAIERVQVIGFLVNWMKAYIHIRKNQEQFYLYLIISVAAGMLLCLTLVIGRLTLQRRRSSRKNSLSSASNNEKNLSDKVGSGGSSKENKKFQHGVPHETQLNTSFGDDASDVDADMDISSRITVPGLTTRNESHMTYDPISNCSYDSVGEHSATNYGPSTAILMPVTSQYNSNLIMSKGYSNANSSSNKQSPCPTMVATRHTTPPTSTSTPLYTSLKMCSPSVNGTMTMGPHVIAPSMLSNSSNHNVSASSYLSGTVMGPSHHHTHTGTLRRNMLPTSMGMMGVPSPSIEGNSMPQPIVGVPTSSSIYYDTTIPRHFSRGISVDNNASVFYG